MSTTTSWIASKFRLVPNVPVVGSVVSTASMMNRLLLVSAPSALTLPVPDDARSGADQRLVAAADRQLFELLAAHARGRGHGGRRRRSAFADDLTVSVSAPIFIANGDAGGLVGFDQVVGGLRRLEALQRRHDGVRTDRHRREHVPPGLVGHRRPREAAILTRDGHRDARKRRAGGIHESGR